MLELPPEAEDAAVKRREVPVRGDAVCVAQDVAGHVMVAWRDKVGLGGGQRLHHLSVQIVELLVAAAAIVFAAAVQVVSLGDVADVEDEGVLRVLPQPRDRGRGLVHAHVAEDGALEGPVAARHRQRREVPLAGALRSRALRPRDVEVRRGRPQVPQRHIVVVVQRRGGVVARRARRALGPAARLRAVANEWKGVQRAARQPAHGHRALVRERQVQLARPVRDGCLCHKQPSRTAARCRP